MRSILTFFCWLALASSVYANPITIHVPYTKTGNTQAVTRLLIDGLTQHGWQFDERVTANPQLSNETFRVATQPMLMIWGNDLVPTRTSPAYRPAATKQDLVTIALIVPRYLCAVKSISAEDFARRDRVFTIGTTIQPADEQYLQALNQHLGTRHKIIKYTNSREIEGAVAAREIDAVMTSAGLRLEQQGQVRCLFSTSQIQSGSVPLITDQYPHFVPKNYVVASYIVAQNFDDAKLTKLRQDIAKVQREYTPYTTYLERNKNPAAPVALDQQVRLIQELDKNIP